MTITTRDDLINALGNNSSRFLIDKASLSNAVAGQFYSLWRATGQPGQGAIPTAAATCDNTLTGSFNFAQQTAPASSYLAVLESTSANAAVTLEIHDRRMHMGGLSGALTTGQTVNLDLHANIGSDNLAERIGSDDYGDVSWWMEWYADTGATASNATINVTYNDGSSGNLTVVAVGGTLRIGRMIGLNGLIPAADSGKFIRDINTVTLSANTGAAGNFGFTASRFRAANFMPVVNARFTSDWAALGLPKIPNESCLYPVVLCSTTTTGIQRAAGKIAHG
jgi:hypothetical protein